MSIELDYMEEYSSDALAQGAYPSSDVWTADLLNENCSNISDWTDGDIAPCVSSVAPAGQFQFDTNASAAPNAYARRYRTITSPPNRFVIKIRTYFDVLGTTNTADHFALDYGTATWRFIANFATNGLFIVDQAGGAGNEVGSNLVKHGVSAAWQIWEFHVDKSGGEANATVEVFLDGVSKGTFDCDREIAGTNGRIDLIQYGYTTNDMLSHIDYVQAGNLNLQCYSESSIKVQGSYSLKGIARITGSLNDYLQRAVSPTINLTDIIGNKLYIRASRTGSNIKIGIKDSGGVWTEITPNIATANVWQGVDWNISAVSNVNKDVINTIRVTIINASATNTFYLDNMFATAWGKTFSESISLSDSYSRLCSWFRTFIESISLADTLQKKPAKTFSEAIVLSDVLLKKILKTFTESITLTDIYSRLWSIYRTFTETLNLADSLIKKPIKTFIESLHLADTLIKRPAKIFTETITLADTLKKRAHRIFTETLSLTDTVSKKAVKTFLETLHLQDRYSRVVSWYRTFTEKITLIDTVKKVKSNLVQLWKKLMNLFDIEG